MDREPLISIITVVFNGEKYLEQTIKSVIGQNYRNIEYIIIDGGSTDNTLNIIKKYEEHIALWLSEPDKGLYDAMNKGIRLSKGKLVGMVNSDDWYETSAVKTMVDAYLTNPDKTIFHADRFDIKPNGEKTLRKYNPSIFKLKYYGMTFNHPSMFVVDIEYKQRHYETKYRSHSDYKFVLEAFLVNRDKFYYVEKPIVNFRLSGISGNMPFWQSTRDVFEIRTEAGISILGAIFGFILMQIVRLKKMFH